jgi:hypothetical protein
MYGRLVLEWPATAMSYLVVSPQRLENVSPFRVHFSLGKRKKLQGAKSGE